MAMSVVVHLAIISATVVGTTVAGPAPKPEKPRFVPVTMPVEKPKPMPVRAEPRHATAPVVRGPSIQNITIIDVPNVTPVGLPKIDMTGAVAAENIVIGRSGGTPTGPIGGSLIGGEGSSSAEWRGADAYMNLIKTVQPRYPESLRQSGVDGRVLIRFTVDTLGRIDQSSVQIVSETHSLFSRAVREALSGFRFRPAESNGRKVPALAEMPFEFAIRR
jgi:TonB family protein